MSAAEDSVGLRLARFVSSVSHPLYISPAVILAASFSSTDSTAAALYWWAIYQVFATFIPLADLIWRRRTGRISDWHVSRREERKWPIIFGIAYSAAGGLAFWLLSGPNILLACMVSGLALAVITLIVTSFWKISLHLMGNASLAVILLAALDAPLFGVAGAILCFYLVVVAVSRYAVKAHTPAQLIAGALAGITVTWIVFRLMGIYIHI
jgi:membrane-associated phospholipid phosphatase